MTVYVGAIARRNVTASYQSAPASSSLLVPDDITSASISAWLKSGTEFTFEDEPLSWDDSFEIWRYN